MANEWLAYSLANLEDLLGKRRKERLEAEEIRRQVAQQEFENQLRSRQTDISERQFQENLAARQETQRNLEAEREYRRFANIAGGNLPPGPATPELAEGLSRAGFLGSIRTIPGQVFQEEGPTQVGQRLGSYQTPETYQFLGGGAYQEARQRALETAAQREADAAARATQDEASDIRERETRRLIAGLSAGQGAETRELRNTLLGLQAEKIQSELSTQQQERERITTEKATARAEVRDMADSLLTDPLLPRRVGPVEGRLPAVRGPSRDFDRRVARLKAMLSVNSREKLAKQGAISDFESKLLEEAVTSLDQATDEQSFKRELQRISDVMAGVGQNRRPTTGRYRVTIE
jgi:hypothetical protein